MQKLLLGRTCPAQQHNPYFLFCSKGLATQYVLFRHYCKQCKAIHMNKVCMLPWLQNEMKVPQYEYKTTLVPKPKLKGPAQSKWLFDCPSNKMPLANIQWYSQLTFKTAVHKANVDILLQVKQFKHSILKLHYYIIRLLCRCAAVPAHEAYIARTAHPVNLKTRHKYQLQTALICVSACQQYLCYILY